jgi:glutathione synthase/RimK-type ligase-like ATP-grasp enzyme
MYPRIAYVTYSGDLPDYDLPLALAALREARLDAEAVVWDDRGVDWGDFDLVVVRSTWDYVPRRPEFLRWARSVEDVTRLANPAVSLAKNTDKTYLRRFAQAGVPTIPTEWFEPGDFVADCGQALSARGWRRMVVKPNVDGAGLNVALVDSAEEAAEQASQWATRGLTALIQPYLSVVERGAELSVVVLGGQISHAVTRKAPLTNSGDNSPVEAVPVPEAVRELVPDIMRAGSDGEDLLYARIDLVPDDQSWLLMEFEATEPLLFLDAVPGAPTRFAAAVRAALQD